MFELASCVGGDHRHRAGGTSEHLDDGDSAVRVVVFDALGAATRRVAVRGRKKGELESGLRSFFAAMRSFTLATENGVDHVGREHESKVFTFRAVRHKFLGCGDVAEAFFGGHIRCRNR
jgi:hypothetical protein